LEGNLTDRERDLYEYAYMKGYDFASLPKAIETTAQPSEAAAVTLPFEPTPEELEAEE
jgi:hypothetical protein